MNFEFGIMPLSAVFITSFSRLQFIALKIVTADAGVANCAKNIIIILKTIPLWIALNAKMCTFCGQDSVVGFGEVINFGGFDITANAGIAKIRKKLLAFQAQQEPGY